MCFCCLNPKKSFGEVCGGELGRGRGSGVGGREGWGVVREGGFPYLK